MAQRAAIVTGGSSGIGLAIARMLVQEDYGVTVAARRPDKLAEAAEQLAAEGGDVARVAGNMGSEEVVARVVAEHRERFGRLDVLVNNAGVGVGALVADIETKRLDMQLAVNLRSVILFYREAASLLRAAGAEHGNALVVNTSSISGKSGEPWLSVYSATKAAVVGFTESMNKELGQEGIKSTALCPAFVDTAMTDFIKQSIAADKMIQATDISEAVRMLLRSPLRLRDPGDHRPAQPGRVPSELRVAPAGCAGGDRSTSARASSTRRSAALVLVVTAHGAPAAVTQLACAVVVAGTLRGAGSGRGTPARHEGLMVVLGGGSSSPVPAGCGITVASSASRLASRWERRMSSSRSVARRAWRADRETAEGDRVPRLSEGDLARAAAVAMGRQHRTDPIAGGVGPDDDVVGRDPLQHGDPRVARQAVDRLSQVLDGRSAPGSHSPVRRPIAERPSHCNRLRRGPQAIPWRRKEPCT